MKVLLRVFVAVSAVAAMTVPVFAQQVVDIFAFDTNGPGYPGGLILNVNSFDWSVDSALAVGGNQAVAEWLQNPGPGHVFNLYYHARLAQFIDSNSIQHNVPPGIEFTLVAGFQEEVVFATGQGLNSVAGFRATGAPQTPPIGGRDWANAGPPYVPNFVEIYFDDSPNADPLSGTGYNDGTLIFRGTVLADPPGAAASVFSTFGNVVNLDAFGPDNYPAIDSVTGVGGSQVQIGLTMAVDYFDPNFFKVILILSSLVNSVNNLNFTQVNPSANFVYEPGYAPAPGATEMPGGAGIGIPSLGTINGVNGPDVQFQVDGSQSFLVIVPEPLTAGLSLLGTLTAAAVALSRRRAA